MDANNNVDQQQNAQDQQQQHQNNLNNQNNGDQQQNAQNQQPQQIQLFEKASLQRRMMARAMQIPVFIGLFALAEILVDIFVFLAWELADSLGYDSEEIWKLMAPLLFSDEYPTLEQTTQHLNAIFTSPTGFGVLIVLMSYISSLIFCFLLSRTISDWYCKSMLDLFVVNSQTKSPTSTWKRELLLSFLGPILFPFDAALLLMGSTKLIEDKIFNTEVVQIAPGAKQRVYQLYPRLGVGRIGKAVFFGLVVWSTLTVFPSLFGFDTLRENWLINGSFDVDLQQSKPNQQKDFFQTYLDSNGATTTMENPGGWKVVKMSPEDSGSLEIRNEDGNRILCFSRTSMIASPFIDAIGQDLLDIFVPTYSYELSLNYKVDNPRVLFRLCLSTPSLAFEKDCNVFLGGKTTDVSEMQDSMIFDGNWHRYSVHLQLNEELDENNPELMSWLWIGIDSESGVGTACVDDISLSIVY